MAKTARKFQIDQIVDREITERVATKVKDKDTEHVSLVFAERTRVVPISYMVYFPGGHSTWFETKEAMAQAGVLEDENVEIDLETGMPVRPQEYVDLKALVERKTTEMRV